MNSNRFKYKLYIFKSMLICSMLLTGAIQIMAQKKTDSKKDTVQLKNAVTEESIPGRLFEVNKNRSTAAVSTVNGKTLYNTPTPAISNTLYGNLTGLSVIQGSGEPGFDAAALYIRGIGTYGVNTYKIFVDGFEVDNNYFN